MSMLIPKDEWERRVFMEFADAVGLGSTLGR
jgi:hypothetical protein